MPPSAPIAPGYWLMKSEPEDASVDHLAQAEKQTLPWTGERNYQVRNFMRDAVHLGDGVLFHHSSCAQPGIAGLARIAAAAVPDTTQLDPARAYFDLKSPRDRPRWLRIDVKPIRKTRLLPLTEMRRAPELAGLRVLQRGNRLSITPVTREEWQAVMARLGA